MLDALDKKWIEETFATKKDLGAFATKKDLEAFATKKDLEAFASKKDFDVLKSDVATLAADMSHVRGRMDEMAGHAVHMETLASRMVESADKLGGRLDALEQENKIGAETLRRHTVQIEALATAAGTTLPG
ncbi:MAG: hypothetical protein KGI78_02895 [Patescibacteria group bacterium]|nr:hypothetical protein [Patescibacteria group bacterium]MDE1945464.1 hypothetical protein [Patescibacteria group bacterium]MDE2057777.1 hypothetical protein [Patescibacteria group bacterium]